MSADLGASLYPKILTKFFFTNRGHLPVDVPEQLGKELRKTQVGYAPRQIQAVGGSGFVRPSNAVIDSQRIATAYRHNQGHLATPSRVRQNRVDTGIHFVDNLHDVQVSFLIRGLFNVGYRLTQCDWFYQKGEGLNKQGKKVTDKYVMVVGFTCTSESITLPDEYTEQRRFLASCCWDWCHCWTNVDGVITVNVGGRKPDAKPRHAIVVRDWKMFAARITEPVTEENE